MWPAVRRLCPVGFRPLLLEVICLGLCLAQSPPRILSEAFESRERVVPEGTSVQLSCPVEADPDTLYFEWYRDREPLDHFGDERYRAQGNGVLRIKNAVPEDTGLYMCRAVNGFGRADVNVTLIVLGSPESILRPSSTELDVDDSGAGQGDVQTTSGKADADEVPSGDSGKPRLTQVSRFHGSVVQRLVGSSISLRCVARGSPRPQISWLKNGKPLPDSNMRSGSRRGHWTLFLENLQASDTGNYTCHVYNGLGSVSANFAIRVIDRVRTKPDFVSGYPQNLTVREGETAVFQCVLVSDIPPHVQWLKQVPDGQDDEQHVQVTLLGERFQVLKSTEVVENPDGTFLNKLFIPSASERDSGKYICLGANSMGYSFRSAFLVVINSSSPDLTHSSLILPFPIVIGIAVSGAILLAGFLGLILYCCSSRRFRPVPGSRATTATNTATTSSSSSSGGLGPRTKDHTSDHPSKHLYVGMAYHPHLDDSPARIYIPNGQLHRTVPLNPIFL